MVGAALDNSRLNKWGWVLVFLFVINSLAMMRMGTELPTGQSFADHLDSRRSLSINDPTTPASKLMEPNNFEAPLDSVQPRVMDRMELLSFRNTNDIDLDSPVIYFITPTYHRDTQLVDLTRLGQTLLHDKTIYWILIEDAENCTLRLRRLLDRLGLPYAHVAAKTIQEEGEGPHHRGVEARNHALEVVEQVGVPGVVYFGDDDNAYDIRLFEELKKTKKIGIFGVGLVAHAAYARCLVDKETGKVNGIASKWKGSGKFSMDMAGFSINTNVLFEKRPRFSKNVKRGHLETFFLEQIASSFDDFEPLAHDCTNIFVWHTKTTVKGSGVRNVPGDPDTKSLQLVV